MHPGITRKDIIKMGNLERKTVSYNLKKLKELNLIWKIGDGYEFIESANVKKAMKKRLVLKLIRNEIDVRPFKRFLILWIPMND